MKQKKCACHRVLVRDLANTIRQPPSLKNASSKSPEKAFKLFFFFTQTLLQYFDLNRKRANLPMFSYSIPYTNFPCVACGDELIPHKEQSLHRHT